MRSAILSSLSSSAFLLVACCLAAPSQAATVHLTPAQVQENSALIQTSLEQLQPGDTLFLAGGQYTPDGGVPSYISNTLDVRPTQNRGNNGTANAWITVRNEPGQRPVLNLGTGGRTGFAIVNASYWRIEGLELAQTGDADEYISGLATESSGGSTHDIQFVNNPVHGFGNAGILGTASQLLIEGNTVYDNSWRAHDDSSGIDLVQPIMASTDNSKFAGPLGNPNNNYSIIVRNNTVYFNRNLVADTDHGSNDITDGNGIIFDYFDATSGYAGFGGQALIANNVIYNNGGAGVHLFNSSNVDVFHNTLYQNAWISNGTQLSNVGSNNRWFNNIVMGGNPNIYPAGSTINGGYTNGGNRGWQNVNVNTNVQWNKNLFYNTSDSSFPAGSIVGSDPKFINATLDSTLAPVANFRLLAGSSAVNAGVASTTTNVTKDFDSTTRDSNPDIGAFEMPGSSTPTPTPTGGLIDRTLESGGQITARGENAPNESKAQAFDNSTTSKWLDYSNATWIQYQFAGNASRVITQYKMTSGNDMPGRDPKNWTLQGSNNGTNFVTLNTQSNQSFASRNLTKTYTFTNTTAYKMIRLNITANTDSGGITQMSELRLMGPGVGSAKLAGTVIGTTGSWDGFSTRDKVFDGNLTTFFDSQTDQGWAGLDLGSAKNIIQIKYAPRSGWSNRMVGGKFQGSNTANFTSATDLYTISSAPSESALTSQNSSVSGTFRYVRYLSPSGGYTNIAEAEFWGQ